MERDALRDDFTGAKLGGDVGAVLAQRASRKTVESIRTTDRLMEVMDDAGENAALLGAGAGG